MSKNRNHPNPQNDAIILTNGEDAEVVNEEEKVMNEEPVIDEEENVMKDENKNVNEPEKNNTEKPKKGWKFWTTIGAVGLAAAGLVGTGIYCIVKALSGNDDDDVEALPEGTEETEEE